MSTRAIDLIQSAVEELGIYAPGEPMSDADAERGLAVLNDMLDSWSNENLAMFAQLTQTFPLVINKTAYTIGPGADINGPRPLAIIQAFMTDVLGNNYPIEILQEYEWNQIVNHLINSQVPTCMFYNKQQPVGILNFWPTPILVWTINITSHLELVAFPNLVTQVNLPRGYVPALKTNLAVAIAPFFGKMPSQVTIELASRYLGDVKRKNFVDIPATYDPEIRSRSGRSYNIRTDGWGGRGGGFG